MVFMERKRKSNSDSFFLKGKAAAGKNDRKRKRKPVKQSKDSDEEIESSSDEEVTQRKHEEEPFEEDYETAQEKKVRLAKLYLEEIAKEEKERLEADEEIDDGLISKRLRDDYLKQVGKFRTTVADNCKADTENLILLRCKDHKTTVMCLCVSSDGKFIFSGSKNGGIVKWSISEKKRTQSIRHLDKKSGDRKGHSKNILCIAISSDSKFLAVGDETKDINIWNPDDLSYLNTLKGHRDMVTGLVFRKETHTLYSSSKDRSVRVWSLDNMMYVETLFGHQDSITSIDSLLRERAITAGGRDNTLRLWKIPEESQLIFNGHSGSIDVVRLINEEHFVSGGDDGQLCVWSMLKKKPLCCVKEAHGVDPLNAQPFWITAVASLVNTDLVASGSQDGLIRFWKLADSYRSITQIFTVEVTGFVNGLTFTGNGEHLVAAVGQEHRLGRWTTIKLAKNSVVVISLLHK